MSAEAQPNLAPSQVVQKTSGGNNAYHNFHNDFLHVQDPNERRRLALASSYSREQDNEIEELTKFTIAPVSSPASDFSRTRTTSSPSAC